MAIALVSNKLTAGPGDITSDAINTSGVNFIIIGLTEQTSGGYTIADNKSNTWHPLTAHASSSPDHQFFYAWNAIVGSGHTFTGTGGAFGVLCIAAFSGVKTSADPFDAESGRSGSGFSFGTNTQADAAITPAEDGELIIAGLAGSYGVAVSIDSSLAITDQVATVGGTNYAGALAYLVQGTAASINPMWNGAGGGFGGGLSIACFKQVAAATTRPVKMAGDWGGFAGPSGGFAG